MNFMSLQIDYLLLLQHFREVTGGVFDSFFMFITHFGETTVPLGMLAIIFWSLHSQLAMNIYLNLGTGSFICDVFKNLACIYRPWILDSRIQPLPEAMTHADGYSFPSGHTQNAVSVWGTLALFFKNKFVKILLVLLIFGVALSRNYVGVHTPQDVIVSLMVGTFIIFTMPILLKWVEKGQNRDIVVYCAAIICGFAFLIYEHFKAYPLDYINGELLVNPEDMKFVSFPKTGMFLGVFTGWFVNKRFLHFDGSQGSTAAKIIRAVIGIALYILIYSNAKVFLKSIMDARLAMFCNSFILVVFATIIYPYIINFVQKILIKTKN